MGNRFHVMSANIEVTHRCNAQCAYCFLHNKAIANELSTEQLCYAIGKLIDSSYLFIAFTGGEPFMRNDILTILKHAIDKNVFKINISTNGTLLSDAHIDFLIKHRAYFAEIQI